MKLSKRLKTIASFLPQGSFFADIGSDHAYLPCYVCMNDNSARAIAGEITKGPFNRACQTVKSYGLGKMIEVRLGNGLEVIKDDQITELVIAGMGGSLIVNILENGKKYLKSVERIILQPNIGEKNVRKWLLNHQYILTHESIIKENDKIYEILVADKGLVDQPYQFDQLEKQLLFGPLLLQEKSSVFCEKWKVQYEKTKNIIKQMQRANVNNEKKLQRLKLKLKLIEEVLQK